MMEKEQHLAPLEALLTDAELYGYHCDGDNTGYRALADAGANKADRLASVRYAELEERYGDLRDAAAWALPFLSGLEVTCEIMVDEDLPVPADVLDPQSFLEGLALYRDALSAPPPIKPPSKAGDQCWECGTCGTQLAGPGLDLKYAVCECGTAKGQWGGAVARDEPDGSFTMWDGVARFLSPPSRPTLLSWCRRVRARKEASSMAQNQAKRTTWVRLIAAVYFGFFSGLILHGLGLVG